MDKAVRIGIVGAGFAASFHLRSYRQVQGVPVEIVAIAGLRKARAEDLARRYGIPKCYDDYGQILDDPSVEVVDLAVPNAPHLPMVLQAAQAGKHIICEKPVILARGNRMSRWGPHPRRRCWRRSKKI